MRRAGCGGSVRCSCVRTPVGLDDDFFELGGNSLFAVRIGAALRARGLPSLRLRELYRHPTIRATVRSLAPSDG